MLGKFITIRYLFYIILLFTIGCVHNKLEEKSEKKIKVTPIQDKSILHGKLSNGFEYYIKKNSKPENRVFLNLAVKVGSLQDPDEKQGLAHYVEHMAFNGTKHFPKNTVIKHLETLGMTFGNHTNAHTGYDQTIYKLVVPADNQTNIDDALMIIKDWSNGILFNDDEILKERNVIIEEWRSRLVGVKARALKTKLQYLLNNSKYIHRHPMGSESSIKKILKSDLQTFYRNWYQPQNMALMVSGDIDPLQLEKLIQQNFSDLENNSDFHQKSHGIPPIKQPKIINFHDDEISVGESIFYYFSNQKRIVDKIGLQFFIEGVLIIDILNDRLRQISLTKNPPFFSAVATQTSLPDGTQGIAVHIKMNKTNFQDAFKHLIIELKRLEQHGINESELIQAIESQLKTYKIVKSNEENIKSKSYIYNMKNHFYYQIPLLSYSDKINDLELLLKTSSITKINQLIKKIFTSSHQFIYSQAPEKQKNKMLNQQDYRELLSILNRQPISQYKSIKVENIIQTDHVQGGIETETWIDELSAYHWILSNGAEVVFKPTKIANDLLLYKAFSEGGTSVITPKKYRNALDFTTIISKSGVGNIEYPTLVNILQTKNIKFSYFAGTLFHGLKGSTTTGDIETFMKLNYLFFSQPRIDVIALDNQKQKVKDYQKYRLLNPQQQFYDEFTTFYYKNHFRKQPWREQHADEFNQKILSEIQSKWFGNANNFKFIIVGDIEKDTLKHYVTNYIASLPGDKSKLTWKDNLIRPAKGLHSFTRKYLDENKAFVNIKYTSQPLKWSETDRQYALSFSKIAGVMLRNALREELSSTYTVSVNARVNKIPYLNNGMTIKYSCEPKRVDQLISTTKVVLEQLATGNFSELLVENEKERWNKSRETGLQSNQWWLNKLSYIYEQNKPYSFIDQQKTLVDNMKKSDIQDIAKKLFNTENIVISTLLPKPENAESIKTIMEK